MSSSRIQLQVIKKSSDSNTKRIRYLVKTNQMLVKMMDKFCQYIGQPRSNVHFYHNGRQLKECETANSAHFVPDDTIEAILLGKKFMQYHQFAPSILFFMCFYSGYFWLDSGMPESYGRNITLPNEQVALADHEKISVSKNEHIAHIVEMLGCYFWFFLNSYMSITVILNCKGGREQTI